MIYSVMIDPKAEASYIAIDQQSPLNAQRLGVRIYDGVNTLATFPHRCSLAPENEFSVHEVRVLNVSDCLLLYVVNDETRVVRVVAFRHGRQLPITDVDTT